ncbi:MAG: LTA synthase family protein [Solobacterium sp.]|nr:LTA synthase family protein [Solobacterium sp.]
MKQQDRFLFSLIRLFVCWYAAELLFQLISFGGASFMVLLRITLFTLGTAGICAAGASFLSEKTSGVLTAVLSWFFPLYAVTEMEFKNFMGNYMSIKAGGDGAVRITEFIGQFIIKIEPVYLTVLILPLLFSIYAHTHAQKPVLSKKTRLFALVLAVILDLCGVWTVYEAGQMDLYLYPKFLEKALREFGPQRFLFRDILALGKEEDLTIDTGPQETTLPEQTQVPEETPAPEEKHRVIDDTAWLAVVDSEENEDILSVDRYLMQRPVTDFNEMTGVMKDKNLIYIMIEAFDYIALDPELTPTLTMMKAEGIDLTRHYTPKYSCTTGESEFISEVSLIPESDTCTPNQYRDNTWNESIFQLFRNAGYNTQAYHNWKDEFYERRTIYGNSGCQVYKNYDDLPIRSIQGWQSDYEMMTLTVDDFIDQERFFTLYVTSSTHFPYNLDSVLGNRYLSEINAVHPDYPMEVKRYLSKAIELDKAMAYLLERLTEAGKLNDTAIVFYADHHPLNMPMQYMTRYTEEIDRTEGMNEDRTPCVIYCPSLGARKVDRVTSTFDLLPTVANLYGLSYDPRLYLGTDCFAEESTTVYFTTGSWITEDGIWYSSSGTFEPFEGHDLTQEQIDRKNTDVQNLFKVSSLIFRNDYFAQRETIADAVYE